MACWITAAQFVQVQGHFLQKSTHFSGLEILNKLMPELILTLMKYFFAPQICGFSQRITLLNNHMDGEVRVQQGWSPFSAIKLSTSQKMPTSLRRDAQLLWRAPEAPCGGTSHQCRPQSPWEEKQALGWQMVGIQRAIGHHLHCL